MAERADRFLARVSAALARAGAWRREPSTPLATPTIDVGPDLVAHFKTKAEAVAAHVRRCTRDRLVDEVLEIARAHALVSFATFRTPLLDGVGLGAKLEAAGLERLEAGDRAIARERYRGLGLGVCEAELAIAETGSVVLTTGPGRPRLVASMPRIQIVVVPVAGLRASMADIVPYAATGRAQPASNIVVVTGPSRTADIENVLVVGIHGPAELYVLLLD